MSTTRNGSRPNSIARRGAVARRDRQPRDADRVDHRGAEGRRADRPADPAVPAQLREPADERRRDDEPDEIAAGRAPDHLHPALALGEERQADDAERDVQQRRRAAAPQAERPADDEHAEVLERVRHRVARDRERHQGAQVDEDRAGDDQQGVPDPGRCPLADPDRDEEVADRQALLKGGHARHRRHRVGHRAPRAPGRGGLGESINRRRSRTATVGPPGQARSRRAARVLAGVQAPAGGIRYTPLALRGAARARGARGDLSSMGRALDCGSRGYGFEPHRSPQLPSSGSRPLRTAVRGRKPPGNLSRWRYARGRDRVRYSRSG